MATVNEKEEEHSLFQDGYQYSEIDRDDIYEEIKKSDEEFEGGDQEWKTFYIPKKDKRGLEGITEGLRENYNVAALIRYQLSNSLLDRIRKGKYDPYKLITRVGETRMSHREKVDIRPVGDLSWEEVERVAEIVTKDVRLAHKKYEREGSLYVLPVRSGSRSMLLRAAGREMVKGKEIFSVEEAFWAERLREEET